MTRESTAARALVAHFNQELASRLVRRILKEKSEVAWNLLANRVLELIPSAAREVLWGRVCKYVEREGESYIDSDKYRSVVAKLVEQHANVWAGELIQRSLLSLAQERVRKLMNSYDMSPFLKGLQGRLQLEIEKEISRVALEVAKEKAKTG